jgi:hypothetical protein
VIERRLEQERARESGENIKRGGTSERFLLSQFQGTQIARLHGAGAKRFRRAEEREEARGRLGIAKQRQELVLLSIPDVHQASVPAADWINDKRE